MKSILQRKLGKLGFKELKNIISPPPIDIVITGDFDPSLINKSAFIIPSNDLILFTHFDIYDEDTDTSTEYISKDNIAFAKRICKIFEDKVIKPILINVKESKVFQDIASVGMGSFEGNYDEVIELDTSRKAPIKRALAAPTNTYEALTLTLLDGTRIYVPAYRTLDGYAPIHLRQHFG